MEDFEQEQDGLPVFTKKPAQQATEDGLPILKKKELSQDGGKPSAQNSPSTSISSLGPGADLASGAVLKTIKPNTEDVSINENVVTPVQNKTGKSKSIIDRDIDMSLNFSLKNPALTKTKDKIDLSTPNPNQQPGLSMPFDQQVAVQKRQITSDPQLLKEYGQTRMKQIGETINQFNTAADDASKTYVGDKTLYADNENSIALKTKAKELEDYQNQFRDSLKTQAAISVTGKALQLGQQLDPIQIGREVLDVISDPTLKDDEKAISAYKTPGKIYATDPMGNSIEISNTYNATAAEKSRQNIDYNLYRTGADAMKLYWDEERNKIYNDNPEKIQEILSLNEAWNNQTTQQRIDPFNPINIRRKELLKDPIVQEYNNANTNYSQADIISASAIKQFPQVERLDMIKKIQEAFFNLNELKDNATVGMGGYSPWKMIFGATPSKEDIPTLAKWTGYKEEDVKNIVDEGSVFSDIPYRTRVNGLFQNIALAAGTTLDQMAMGLRRWMNPDSPDTEAKNRIAQDFINEKSVEAQRNKLQGDNGGFNFNPYSIASSFGYGLGQMAIQAIPMMITGGLAAEGSLMQKGLDIVSTVIPGAAASYEDAYKTAAAVTDDPAIRKAYAFWNAMANGGAELLYSPGEAVKVTSSILFPKKAVGKELVNSFMEDVAKKGIDKTINSRLNSIGKQVWGVIKEPLNLGVSENFEEQFTNVSTNALDENMLGIKRTQAELADQALSTLVQTTFQTLPSMLGVGIGGNHDMSGIRKQALFEVGKQPDLYKSYAQEWLDNGRINQSQFNQKVSQINQLQNIVSSLPSKDSKGKNLSYEDLSELAAQQFRIDTNEKKIKEGALSGELPLIESDTKEAIQKQTKILNKEETEEPIISEETKKTEIVFPVRNNDFAEKYFSKEAKDGEESEFDVWNRLKNEDPQAASEMVQNKKNELTNVSEETVSTPVSKEEGKVEGLNTNEGFQAAGNKSKEEQSPSHIGNWLIDNAQTGDKIKIDDDSYYEVTRRTTKKGHTEIELQHFVKNENGEFENNPSAVKIFTDKYRGTDLEKLGYRGAGEIFQYGYTDSEGNRKIQTSEYIPKNETIQTEVSKPTEGEGITNEKTPQDIGGAKETKIQETINEGGQNDSTNQQGVSGEVREGQEPVQTQPNEGASGEETSPGGNVQTPEGQEEVDHDYTAREQAVRDYAKESGIELDEEEADLATGLVGEADSVKDAVDFVVQDRINNSVQPLYNYIQEIKSDKIRNREKQKLVDDHFDDIVTQLVTNKKLRKEC